ncbi:unnamed protein product, partial [Pleuronectes platessa]
KLGLEPEHVALSKDPRQQFGHALMVCFSWNIIGRITSRHVLVRSQSDVRTDILVASGRAADQIAKRISKTSWRQVQGETSHSANVNWDRLQLDQRAQTGPGEYIRGRRR